MSGVKLYELTADMQAVLGWMEEHDAEIRVDGEIPPALAELLSKAEGAFEQKAERVALMILSLKADAGALDTEVKRLAARKKATESRITWMQNYLRVQMELAGTPKIKTARVTFWRAESVPTIRGVLDAGALELLHALEPVLVDAETIPEHVAYTLNKDAVLERARERDIIVAARETRLEEYPDTTPEELDDLFPVVQLPTGLSVERSPFLQIR
jgi:hypothetical protein